LPTDAFSRQARDCWPYFGACCKLCQHVQQASIVNLDDGLFIADKALQGHEGSVLDSWIFTAQVCCEDLALQSIVG